MDNMNFLSRLSERTGLPAAETEKMVNALSAIIAEKCSALDCVANLHLGLSFHKNMMRQS